jgi:predicted lipid-binding transport protein (Tim44 family)
MRKIDPDFELNELENLARYLLEKVLKAYFSSDVDTIELLTSESASAVFSAIVKARLEKGLECKYKEPLFIDDCRYRDCEIIDENTVKFQFAIEVQENNCLIDKEGAVQDGSPTKVERCSYLFEMIIDHEAEVDRRGHNWSITKIIKTDVVEQLI